MRQTPDAGRKYLLRKGSCLPGLFLFQTCLNRVDSMGIPLWQCALEKSAQKPGRCPPQFPSPCVSPAPRQRSPETHPSIALPGSAFPEAPGNAVNMR